MPYRSPTRFLAPLALVAAFFAVMVVVSSKSDSSSEPAVTSTATTTTSKPKQVKPKAKSYTVKSGDVLSGIADRTGVPLERILDLNPDLDPQSLQAGQKIKLSR